MLYEHHAHAPVEALKLKVLHDGPLIINVQFAGERCC
jgi:hypothetical protein